MNQTNNPKLTPNARKLRKNMTRQERHLWYDFLKTLPVTIHRQKVIGPYIADFYCAKAGLVIELDGSQHFERAGQDADRSRDGYFQSLGLRVLRYSNLDVDRNFDGVCADILRHLAGPTSSVAAGAVPPSPRGEGGNAGQGTIISNSP